MPLRPPAGFISAFYDPLENPDAPTIGTATGGDASASVTFTAPTNVGGSAISLYGARSTPENITATAASSPISVTGLTNGTAYTFAVWAINTYGPSAFSAASGSVTPVSLRGLFAGGSTGTSVNTIDYIVIPTTGSASDFGDLTYVGEGVAGCASSTRGIFAGGGGTNLINYVTIASTGNASDFGTILTARLSYGGCSNATRGLIASGSGGGGLNIINYVTIATLGDRADFGDLIVARAQVAGCASPTRGVFGGGKNLDTNTIYNTIDYVTIATTGNATDFGDLTVARTQVGACSSSTRGVFAAGGISTGDGYSNVIDYITIASAGNATDFGDMASLLQTPVALAGCSSETRGVFGGGIRDGGVNVANIRYITIASTGNASSFGDLTEARYGLGACSNCHGGL
jgi:hypothetical protein